MIVHLKLDTYAVCVWYPYQGSMHCCCKNLPAVGIDNWVIALWKRHWSPAQHAKM